MSEPPKAGITTDCPPPKIFLPIYIHYPPASFPLTTSHPEHVLGVTVTVALSLCVFVCVTAVMLTGRSVVVTVLTGSVIIFSTVPENFVNGGGVIVAVDIASVVEIVVVVELAERVISVAVTKSVVLIVMGRPSRPSRLARAQASGGTAERRR